MSDVVRNKIIRDTNRPMPMFLLLQMGLLCILLAVQNIFGLDINQYIILAFASFVIPFLKIEHLLSFTAFIIPLATGINGGIFIFLSIAILLKLPKVSPLMTIFPCLLFCIEIWNILFFSQIDHDFKNEIIYLAYIFIFFIMLFVNTDTNLSKRIIRYFIVGMAIVSIIYVLRILQTGSLSMFVASGGRIGESIAEKQSENIGYIVLNANTLGYFSTVGITLCLLGTKILKFNSVVLITCFCIFIVAGSVTISRTWAMTTALAFTLYFLRSIKRPWVWVCAILGIYAIITYDLIPDSFIESFTKRFTQENMETAGGRSEILEQFNEFMFSNPEYLPFGISIFNYDSIAHVGHSTHNAIQQIFVTTGLTGLLIFIIAAIKFYKLYIRPSTGPWFRWTPLIIAAIFLQTIQFLNPHILMMPLVMTTFVFKIQDWRIDKKGKLA